MATSDSDMLTLINQVITDRLNGGGYDGYTVQQKTWVGMPLDQLFRIRRELQASVRRESSGGFALIDPID